MPIYKVSILDFNGYFKRTFFGDNEVTKTKCYQLIVNDGKTLEQFLKL